MHKSTPFGIPCHLWAAGVSKIVLMGLVHFWFGWCTGSPPVYYRNAGINLFCPFPVLTKGASPQTIFVSSGHSDIFWLFKSKSIIMETPSIQSPTSNPHLLLEAGDRDYEILSDEHHRQGWELFLVVFDITQRESDPVLKGSNKIKLMFCDKSNQPKFPDTIH